MNHIEALDLALEALESFAPHNGVFWRNLHKDDAEIAKAITAIKQALAAPVQEPVAWMFEDDEDNGHKTFRQTPPSPEVVAYLAKWNRPAWVPIYTTPPAQEFVCSTGLCHYKATSEKRECMNCAAFGECNPNNDAGRCGHEPPAAQRQWVGLTDEEVYPLANEHLHYQTEGYEVSGVYNLARAIEAKLKEKNT